MLMIIEIINAVDAVLWAYMAVPLICMFGLYATWQTGAIQVRKAKRILLLAKECYQKECAHDERGINPLHAFYITLGGCVGIANIVAVCTAIKFGGPGALFWMWVTALFGMLVKYAEVYLGVQYRVENSFHSYDGGPIYYLKKVFQSQWPSLLFALMLGIYGVEVYMFKVVTDSMIINWSIPNYIAIIGLLALILVVVQGGGKRVGYVCSMIMPFFLVLYCLMGVWVLIQHYDRVPGVFYMIITSAFSGQAAVGGFGGSTAMIALSQGVKRACYTGDIGVGYAGMVCAESSHADPKQQADLSILGIFLDTFLVCTMTVLLVLVTDVWTLGLPESEWVHQALAMHFPLMYIFMPVLIFLLGYSSLIAFFHVGSKAMRYVSPQYGERLYLVYAILAFVSFSFVDQSEALLLMSLCGACMLLLNVYAIIKLYKDIDFN